MAQQEARILWDKYKAGKASLEEEQLLRNWFHSLHAEDIFDLDPAEMELIHADMLKHIGQHISGEPAPVSHKLWPRLTKISMSWKIAAAVAAITLGTWLYYTPRHPEESRDLLNYANDIAPGRNTATITLADGTVINLDTNRTGIVFNSDDLTYADGTSVTSSLLSSSSLRGKHSDEAISQTLTASTPRGGTYQITLPDGTAVWLNADSKITFPSKFTGAKRQISLEGEAYFQVAKNKAKPFIVESGGTNGMPAQQIEVLGTHFNVNAYPDEGSTKTTLLEGSVNVNGTILRPNQQASLQGEAITVKQIDPSETLAWKNGDFILNNDDFRTVMRKLSRWYNVEVIYATDAPYDLELYGEVSRSKNISAVLSVIEATGKVHFRIEGKKIYVSK
jgi:transmembrane sensor